MPLCNTWAYVLAYSKREKHWYYVDSEGARLKGSRFSSSLYAYVTNSIQHVS
uniref:Uncharacterized protein n=1 Tax=Triticum urartu TaxID=4572 RepID=A0A8R7R9K7_TRIUA